MTSREFCYWLQGHFEINEADHEKDQLGSLGDFSMSDAKVRIIKKHLSLVFKHEIDPSYGDEAHQAELNSLHDNSHLNSGLDENGLRPRC